MFSLFQRRRILLCMLVAGSVLLGLKIKDFFIIRSQVCKQSSMRSLKVKTTYEDQVHKYTKDLFPQSSIIVTSDAPVPLALVERNALLISEPGNTTLPQTHRDQDGPNIRNISKSLYRFAPKVSHLLDNSVVTHVTFFRYIGPTLNAIISFSLISFVHSSCIIPRPYLARINNFRNLLYVRYIRERRHFMHG